MVYLKTCSLWKPWSPQTSWTFPENAIQSPPVSVNHCCLRWFASFVVRSAIKGMLCGWMVLDGVHRSRGWVTPSSRQHLRLLMVFNWAQTSSMDEVFMWIQISMSNMTYSICRVSKNSISLYVTCHRKQRYYVDAAATWNSCAIVSKSTQSLIQSIYSVCHRWNIYD